MIWNSLFYTWLLKDALYHNHITVLFDILSTNLTRFQQHKCFNYRFIFCRDFVVGPSYKEQKQKVRFWYYDTFWCKTMYFVNQSVNWITNAMVCIMGLIKDEDYLRFDQGTPWFDLTKSFHCSYVVSSYMKRGQLQTLIVDCCQYPLIEGFDQLIQWHLNLYECFLYRTLWDCLWVQMVTVVEVCHTILWPRLLLQASIHPILLVVWITELSQRLYLSMSLW